MSVIEEMIEQILPGVSKPTRYIGNEWNSVRKEHGVDKVSIALAFPDVYEVGMSHLGFKILYHIVNEREDALAERVFAPWSDMEEKMREKGVPLFSLENKVALKDFDLVGFTLQYELSYTNLLNMLDLGQIPLRSKDRDDKMPFVMAGGPCAFNPEPLAEFVDFFVLGDGEEILAGVIEEHKKWKQEDNSSREDFLRDIATLSGIYVPTLYKAVRNSGEMLVVEPLEGGNAPSKVRKNIVEDLDKAVFPDKVIVPFMDIVHDRVTLELFRGCHKGCRFCQAGIIYRPRRERKTETLKTQTENLIKATGYEEVSLGSLSSSDYTEIKSLVSSLSQSCGDQGINLSLPSLRIDSFSLDLANEVQKIRKSGLTFAPEAGTQRLRDVINKNVKERDLFEAVSDAFSSGWHNIKLYFMIGLPTETEEDLEGIVQLAYKVLDIGRQKVKGKRPKITISTSVYVPKPHTPFQWEAQVTRDEMREKQSYLKGRLKRKGLTYSWHDPETSYWEAVMARGDRRVAAALEKAFELGCKFDGWSEHFDPQKWSKAFSLAGLDSDAYAHYEPSYEEVLPWEHIDSGVSKGYLIKEHKKSFIGEITEDCFYDNCVGCGMDKISDNKACMVERGICK